MASHYKDSEVKIFQKQLNNYKTFRQQKKLNRSYSIRLKVPAPTNKINNEQYTYIFNGLHRK